MAIIYLISVFAKNPLYYKDINGDRSSVVERCSVEADVGGPIPLGHPQITDPEE